MPQLRSLLVLFLAIIAGFGNQLFAQPAISAADEGKPAITLLKAEGLNNGGTATILVTAIDLNGHTDNLIEGPYRLRINGKVEEVKFYKGFASLPMSSERVSSFLLKYDSSDGPRQIFKHFRTFGTKTQTSSVPLWTSILPPLIAILLALLFREVVVSLLIGVFTGALLISGFNFSAILPALTDLFEYYILGSLTDKSHVSILLFSMLIGGMVAVISRNGGMYGVVDKLAGLAKSARSTQLVTWMLGMAIFFDDYANTLVVGNTMRPVTDSFRISREKLAYIVDSTAAPVSAIAFITTWIGAELDYIDDAIVGTGITESAYSIFLNSLAYAYYPILTLFFIFILIWMRRDYGGMHKAEVRARTTGELFVSRQDESRKTAEDLSALDPEPGIKHRWYNAFLPILTVVLTTMVGLWVTGYEAMKGASHPYITLYEMLTGWEQFKLVFTSDFLSILIGKSDSYISLLWASSFGLLVAVFMSLVTRALNVKQAVESAVEGFKTMLPALLILVLAWTLASVTNMLHTADYLSGAFSEIISIKLMPLITFVFAALISFSTGSSWSTMAILYPLLLPLTWSIGLESGLSEEAIMPIFYNVTATVLAGSVFGDHCSPISDTTVLSSLACNCNHIDHVRTQMPYALTVGGVSVLAGGLLAPYGSPFFLNFALALLLLLGIVRFIGKGVPSFNGLSNTAVDENGLNTDPADNQS